MLAPHEAFAVFQAKLAAQDRETRDSAFAARQERLVTERLTGVTDDNGQALSVSLLSVDCRTTTCAARLRWADGARATDELHTLMRAVRPVGCAREIFVPPGEVQPGAPVEAAFYFDCGQPPAPPASPR